VPNSLQTNGPFSMLKHVQGLNRSKELLNTGPWCPKRGGDSKSLQIRVKEVKWVEKSVPREVREKENKLYTATSDCFDM